MQPFVRLRDKILYAQDYIISCFFGCAYRNCFLRNPRFLCNVDKG